MSSDPYQCKQERFFCLISSVTALFLHMGCSAEEDVIHIVDDVWPASIGIWERETELELVCRGFRNRTKTEGMMEQFLCRCFSFENFIFAL